MYHSVFCFLLLFFFFIYLPTEGHLGYLQVLAITNKTAINVQVFVDVSFQLLWVSAKECDGWIARFSFVETAEGSSTVAVALCIPTSHEGEFPWP